MKPRDVENDQSSDDPLQSVIAAFLDAEEAGQPLNREQLLEQHPDQADSLRNFFASHDQLRGEADGESVDANLRPGNDELTIAPETPTHRGSLEPTLGPVDTGSEHATMAQSSGNSTSQAGKVPGVGDTVRYFGDYELLSEIARGGMGVVYRARQSNLNRIVALKMILAGQFAGEQDVQRFYTEAEAAAQLDHPGIVPIFEIGEHSGQHYFSMGYIEGDSLAGLINLGPLDPDRAAELVSKICAAIGYAHERGVIHRDLKPANILLDKDGQPKVTDFGLAKRTEGDSNLTGTGQILGTPAYMPPEQASGNIDDIGPLADVYSLGAILYCTLTGRAPFQAANPMDTLLQVLEKDPAPPRQLDPTLPRDLETICLKCLEKDPKRRYQSAAEISEELQRYLNGEPIQARPISTLQRGWKFCRRKPLVSALSAAIGVLLIGVSIAAPLIAWKQASLRSIAEDKEAEARELAEKEVALRDEAESARKEVEKAQERSESLLYGTRISLAQREWMDNNPDRVQELLRECPPKRRDWEWYYLDGLTRAEELSLFTHGIPASVAFLPDGESIVTRGSRDNKIKFWDLSSGLETQSEAVPNLRSVDPIDQERGLVVAGNSVNLIRIKDGERESYGDFGRRAVSGICFDQNRRVAAAFDDGTVTLYKRPDAKEIFRTPKKLKSDVSHVFAPNGRLVAGTQGAKVQAWDVRSGEQKFEIDGHVMKVQALAFSPDGTLLASVGRGGKLILTDTASGEKRHVIDAHKETINAVAFSNDGRLVATGGNDNTARIFDVVTGQPWMALRGNTRAVTGVAFSPDRNRLATTAQDGTTRIWNIGQRLATVPEVQAKLDEENVTTAGHALGLESRVFYGHTTNMVYDVAISPDGKLAATTGVASGDTSGKELVTIWSLEDSEVYAKLPVTGGFLHTVNYTSDGKFLIVTSGGAGDAVAQGTVTVWNLETKEKLFAVEGGPCMLARGVLNPKNDVLAMAFGGINFGTIRFHSFPEGELLHEMRVDKERISSIVFSADGSALLSSSTPGGSVRVWDVASGQEVNRFQAHGAGVFQLAMSRDDVLATANIDRTIGVWDWKSAKKLGELKGHTTYAADICFSPDGKRLVSSSEDKSVKVWDVDNFTELLSFRDHTAPALGADWSRDGRSIATTSRDGAMILRELSAGQDSSGSDTTEDWVTLFEEDFEDAAIGTDWGGSGGEIRDGMLLGSQVKIPLSGFSFPGFFLSPVGVVLPRTVEVSVDVKLRQPMLTQLVLTNSGTQEYIAPFVSGTAKPFNFLGSSVQVARGEGENTKILGAKTDVRLEVGKTHRLRLVRQIDELQLFVDGRLVEHVRVPTINADQLSLSGCWSNVGDQVEFDNVLIRAPKAEIAKLEIREQVKGWVDKLVVADLVKEYAAAKYTDPKQLSLAETLADSLTAGRELSSRTLIDSALAKAANPQGTQESYEMARRQAEYYLEREDNRWQLSKAAMALYRGGDAERALEVVQRAYDENMEKSGHVWAQIYGVRALALSALGRQGEALADYQSLKDLQATKPGPGTGLPALKDELAEKLQLDRSELRDTLLALVAAKDRGYWQRNIPEAYKNTSDDFKMVLGRDSEEHDTDLSYDRAAAAQLEAFHSCSNPPPNLELFWDDVEFSETDQQADMSLISTMKFDDMIFRFGMKYRFEKNEEQWQIASLRSWQIDQRIGGQWESYDSAYYEDLESQIQKLPAESDELPRLLIRAWRFTEAYQVGKSLKESGEAKAEVLAALGEAAISLKKWQEGITTLEQARRLDPGVRMPWYYTRSMRIFDGKSGQVFGADFNSKVPKMISAHQDRCLIVWDLETGKMDGKIDRAHRQPATDVRFSHDGTKQISIGFDGAINVRQGKEAKMAAQLTGHLGVMYRLEQHPTSNRIVTSSADGTAKIWDLDLGREWVTLSGHTGGVFGADFSPDGSRVATASRDGTIRLWDAETGKEQEKIDAHSGGVTRVDWTPDGKWLLSGGHDDHRVKVWDVQSLKLVKEFPQHQARLEAVRVSPDGKLAASTDIDGAIWIWDLVQLKPVGVLWDQGPNYNVRFRGNTIFTVGKDITQWDVDFSRSFLESFLDPLASGVQDASAASAE